MQSKQSNLNPEYNHATRTYEICKLSESAFSHSGKYDHPLVDSSQEFDEKIPFIYKEADVEEFLNVSSSRNSLSHYLSAEKGGQMHEMNNYTSRFSGSTKTFLLSNSNDK